MTCNCPLAMKVRNFFFFFLKGFYGLFKTKLKKNPNLIFVFNFFVFQAPSSILESLETHMNGLEDVKGGKKG